MNDGVRTQKFPRQQNYGYISRITPSMNDMNDDFPILFLFFIYPLYTLLFFSKVYIDFLVHIVHNARKTPIYRESAMNEEAVFPRLSIVHARSCLPVQA